MSAVAEELESLLAAAGQAPLGAELAVRFEAYLELLLRWNGRINLTAIRDPEGILSRHFVESIACARALPSGMHSLLDLGSGAGFPGLPIALCHPGLSVILAESQTKKAAFLQEAVRTLGLSTQVHSGRAEALKVQFDCVTLRAVDRMELATRTAASLVRPGGWLAPITTDSELAAIQLAAGGEIEWQQTVRLSGSFSGLIALGMKR